MRRIINIILTGLILSTYASKAQTIITDRPDQTEGSSTIPQGSFQLEAGVKLGFIEIDAQKEREFVAPTILFRFGIIKALEIRLVAQYASVKNRTTTDEVNRIGDVEIGAKVQILRMADLNVEIAFLSHLVIPTSSFELTDNKVGTVNKLAISHELGRRVGLGYNVGYNYFGINKGIFTYSLALGVGITDKLSIYIEPYGDVILSGKFLSKFDAGFTYLLKDNLQLDISYGFGMNYTMSYMALGVSWNLNKANKNS